jgi:hypothetical protein
VPSAAIRQPHHGDTAEARALRRARREVGQHGQLDLPDRLRGQENRPGELHSLPRVHAVGLGHEQRVPRRAGVLDEDGERGPVAVAKLAGEPRLRATQQQGVLLCLHSNATSQREGEDGRAEHAGVIPGARRMTMRFPEKKWAAV